MVHAKMKMTNEKNLCTTNTTLNSKGLTFIEHILKIENCELFLLIYFESSYGDLQDYIKILHSYIRLSFMCKKF